MVIRDENAVFIEATGSGIRACKRIARLVDAEDFFGGERMDSNEFVYYKSLEECEASLFEVEMSRVLTYKTKSAQPSDVYS